MARQANTEEAISKKKGKGVHFAGAGKESDSEEEDGEST